MHNSALIKAASVVRRTGRLLAVISAIAFLPAITVALVKLGSLTGMQQPASPPKKKIVVSQEVAMRLLINSAKPNYPDEARAAHVKGVVLVKTEIGIDGHVVDAQSIEGPELLRQAALDAVRQWIFRPFVIAGEAIEVETKFSIKIPN